MSLVMGGFLMRALEYDFESRLTVRAKPPRSKGGKGHQDAGRSIGPIFRLVPSVRGSDVGFRSSNCEDKEDADGL